jgi:hypothetical protein
MTKLLQQCHVARVLFKICQLGSMDLFPPLNKHILQRSLSKNIPTLHYPICRYVSKQPSPMVSHSAKLFSNRLGSSRFAVLHLQRGDTVLICDTNIPRVLRSVDCMSSGAASNGLKDAHSLDVDETSPAYLDPLVKALRTISHWQGRVHHGDFLLAEFVKDSTHGRHADNYLVFAAAMKLMNVDAAMKMEMRRGNCPVKGGACSDVEI